MFTTTEFWDFLVVFQWYNIMVTRVTKPAFSGPPGGCRPGELCAARKREAGIDLFAGRPGTFIPL
jgi:hypothetical protein